MILLQRTSTDGFTSMAGGMGSVLSQRSTGNFLVKLTIFLIAAFMINSIVLARLVVKESGGVLDPSQLDSSIAAIEAVEPDLEKELSRIEDDVVTPQSEIQAEKSNTVSAGQTEE